MKAVFIDNYGDISKLKYGNQNKPVPKKGQVLVRVKAAAVNPRDWIIREGNYVFRFALPKFPIILGSDISGEVVETNHHAGSFSAGDEVFGMQPLNGGMGGYAQYIAIDESALSLKPKNISHIQAAAVPCAGLTAWIAITEIAKVQSGQRITICGASGGVGTYAVQFAKAAGAIVTGVCGPNNIELVKKLGADFVINYKEVHYTNTVKRQDTIFDAVGRDSFKSAKTVMNSTGKYITTIPSAMSTLETLKTSILRIMTFDNSKTSHIVFARPSGRSLEKIATLMEEGNVQSVIDSIYPLEEAKMAHKKSRSWHASGKIILEIP